MTKKVTPALYGMLLEYVDNVWGRVCSYKVLSHNSEDSFAGRTVLLNRDDVVQVDNGTYFCWDHKVIGFVEES